MNIEDVKRKMPIFREAEASVNLDKNQTHDMNDIEDEIRKQFEEEHLKGTCFETLKELIEDKTLVDVNAPRALIACELSGRWHVFKKERADRKLLEGKNKQLNEDIDTLLKERKRYEKVVLKKGLTAEDVIEDERKKMIRKLNYHGMGKCKCDDSYECLVKLKKSFMKKQEGKI